MSIEIIGFINSLAGHHLPCRRQIQWDTDIVPLSGSPRRSQRNQVLEQPIRHWFINFSALRADEQEKFEELFNRGKGRYDTFLILDTDPGGDFHCGVSEWSYTAAAAETATQLQKTYYKGQTEEWTEDKIDIVPGNLYAPTVWLDSVEKTEGTHFTLDDTTGLIDWTSGSAPQGALTGGEIIQADYRFYFRVRFDMDVYDQVRDLPTYWQVMGLHLVEDR